MSWRSVLRWLPVFVIMVMIFFASNTPARGIPTFGPLDMVVKKSGHMLGYALLAGTFWFGLKFKEKGNWMALGVAVLYAMTDEFHQLFIPGRHSSWMDVFVFDGGGAAIALILLSLWILKKPSTQEQ